MVEIRNALEQLVGSGVDLTSYMTKGVAARGTFAPNIRSDPAVDGLRRFSSVTVNVHATTHLEFPWTFNLECIPAEDYPDGRCPFPQLNSSESSDILREYHRPRVLDALLLDHSDKQHLLSDLLQRHGVAHPGGPPMLLGTQVTTDQLRKVMRGLRISYEDILAKVGDPSLFKGAFLAFFTGWDTWRPPFKDLNHPVFECWHPFLLHPYLDETTITQLLDAGVEGIGSDTYGFECPLYYADPLLSMPAVAALVSEARTQRSLGPNIRLPKLPPVHFQVLSRYKYMVESLYLTESLFYDQRGYSTYEIRKIPFGNRLPFRRGTILLQPLCVGDPSEGSCPPDATFVRVTFFPDGRS